MKKSLQYVLIMSALGLQSGVLLAQQDDTAIGEQVGQPKGMNLGVAQLADILDSYQRSPDYDALSDQSDIKWLREYFSQNGQNVKFDTEWFSKIPYPRRRFLFNTFTYSPLALKNLTQLPTEVQKKYVLEAAYNGDFESFRALKDLSAVFVFAGNVGWNAYSGELKPFMTESAKKRIGYFLSSPTPDPTTKNPQFTISGFGASAFTLRFNIEFNSILKQMLDNNLVRVGGGMDLKRMFDNKDFSKVYQSSIVGCMVHTWQGRSVVARAAPFIRDSIVNVVYNLRKNSAMEPAFMVQAQLGLLKTQMEYKDEEIIGKDKKEAIVESLKQEFINNRSISFYDKATFVKILKKPSFASKTNDEFSARLEEKIMKEVPEENAKKIEVYLRDKNLNASESDFELEATGAPEARRDQKTDGDDARKGIIKVKDLQTDIDADKKGVDFEVDEADIKVKEKTEKIKETK